MTVSVIVATYKRPAYLEKCLNSLLRQRIIPDEIIVISQETDPETSSVVEKIKQAAPHGNIIKCLNVSEANIVLAENKGLESASADIVCFIDDDALAPEDWTEKILKHYDSDDSVGAVGGPVISVVSDKQVIEYTDIFARITWYGRRITNARKVPRSLQEADSLAGCNMSFRRRLIGKFDEKLLAYWRRFEDDACQSVKELGYKVIADPDIRVLHFEANTKGVPAPDATSQRIIGLHHNSMYVKIKHSRGLNKLLVVAYEFFWGDDAAPGIIPEIFYALKSCRLRKISKPVFVLLGKLRGIWTYFIYLNERNK